MAKRIANVLMTIVCAAMVTIAALFVLIKLSGGGVYTVLSGSMEPTYRTGSLLYVRPVDYRDLQEGDPITYAISEEMVATHRIVGIIKDTDEEQTVWFRTKGDANDTADAVPVHYKNVIGVPVIAIPYLGYAAQYIQTPVGRGIALILIAALLLAGILPTILQKSKNALEEKE